jgi:hypothetical protein
VFNAFSLEQMGLLYVFLFYLWLVILGLLASLLAKGVEICEVLDGKCWREGVMGSFRELLEKYLKVADFK